MRDADVIPLSPKIIDLLLYLVARQSALVPKDELFKALWPDVAVTDNALTQAVSELRQALGDDPSKPTYIQTVARRGYRFIAPVNDSRASWPWRALDEHGDRHRSRCGDLQQPAIAVLDFANVSGDREFAWLSSGIAETVTNDLRAHRTAPRHRSHARRRGGQAWSARTWPRCEPIFISTLRSSGSFQRAGIGCASPRVSLTRRRGEAMAEAKADGPLEQVFELQDRIVAQFADDARRLAPSGAPASHGETSSLEAYRAFTEGARPARVARRVAGSGRDRRFRAGDRARSAIRGGARRPRERALLAVRDVARAKPAGCGRCWRARSTTSAARSSSSATSRMRTRRLSFLLVSAGRATEALAAARRAVALEPGYWGNQFRLAHAAWGEERLQALARAMRPLSGLSRSPTSRRRWCTSRAAHSIAPNRCCAKARSCRIGRRIASQRYPAKGLHWLLAWCGWRAGDRRAKRSSSSIARSGRIVAALRDRSSR